MSNDKKPSTPPGQGNKGGGSGSGTTRGPGSGTGTRTPDSGRVIKGDVPTNSGGPRHPDGGSKKK